MSQRSNEGRDHRRRPGLSELIARLLGKQWDQRVPTSEGRPDPSAARDERADREDADRPESGADVEANDEELLGGDDVVTVRGSVHDLLATVSRDARPNRAERPDLTAPLTLDRVEAMLTGPLGYGVQRHVEDDHPCLLGTWDGFPFVIEVPDGHEGWLLVSGDWQEPAREGERDEIAASVNDWNRDKFFPTVAILDTDAGALVRATYLTDLTAGVSDKQLRLHLDTALSACTQALSHIGPLLPEL